MLLVFRNALDFWFDLISTFLIFHINYKLSLHLFRFSKQTIMFFVDNSFVSFFPKLYLFLVLKFYWPETPMQWWKKKGGGVIEILVLFLILKRIFPKFAIKNVCCKLLINIYVAQLEKVIIMNGYSIIWNDFLLQLRWSSGICPLICKCGETY